MACILLHTFGAVLVASFLCSVDLASACRYGVRFFEPLMKQLLNFVDSSVRHGAPRMLESDRFAHSLKAYYGKETFATAFARTGRIVCITVTTQRGGGQAGTSRSGGGGSGAVLYGSGEAGAGSGAGSAQPLVLNYLTSPDVLVSSD